ncbi:MAG: helix-turn-helix domain-containing protein [Acidobacteria bacterium]|nr:helix-turn-helix domain-containing protein [Acidobacteriota bacterium]
MLAGEQIDIHKIIVNGGSQPRAALDDETIARYAEAMANGVGFPPVVVFYDGECYWLADGYHRRKAELKLGRTTTSADVRQGTLRDAILYSVSANNGHGLPASNADRRRAVLTLLNDPEWSKWSDREIARRCGVSPDTVGRQRRAGESTNRFEHVTWLAQGKIAPQTILSESDSMASRTFVHPKTGQPTTMRTGNIGRSRSDSEEEWEKLREKLADRTDDEPRGGADEWVETGGLDDDEDVVGDFDPQAEINAILKVLGGTRQDPLNIYNKWRMLLMRLKAERKKIGDYLYGQTEAEINDLILSRIAKSYPKVSQEDIEEAAASERERILMAKAAEDAAYKAARPYGSFDETAHLFEMAGLALATHPNRPADAEMRVRRICHRVIETGFGLIGPAKTSKEKGARVK